MSEHLSQSLALRDLADALRRSRRLVVLTGAGVSRESGIPHLARQVAEVERLAAEAPNA